MYEGETFSRGPAGFIMEPGRREDYDALADQLDPVRVLRNFGSLAKTIETTESRMVTPAPPRM